MSILDAKLLLLVTAACCLTACGGGGESVNSTPAPSPAPVQPPPPPPPPLPPGAYLTPGVTQSTNFSVVGWEVDTGDRTASDAATNGFSITYDAATQGYFVTLPSYQGAPASQFQQTGQSTNYYNGQINGSGMNPAQISFLKPGSAYRFSDLAMVNVLADYPASVFAFGQATPSNAVPITGSATYSSDVLGVSLSNSFYFGGFATFNFDFGAGTLGGQMTLDLHDLGGGASALGTYGFTNTVYGTGSASFSGSLRDSASGLGGAFLGQFTGPGAEELMARWNVDFRNPDTNGIEPAVGALIGRRISGP